MSEENVEIVRRLYDAFSRDDSDAAFRDAHRDFEVTFKEGPRAGTHRGRKALQEVADDLRAGFESWVFEPLELIERGDQVVAIVNNRLQPKGGTTGEFTYRNGSIFTIRDGTVLSMVGYPTPEAALEAAGLLRE
jgi:ketosteroid isomerase-like protein